MSLPFAYFLFCQLISFSLIPVPMQAAENTPFRLNDGLISNVLLYYQLSNEVVSCVSNESTVMSHDVNINEQD